MKKLWFIWLLVLVLTFSALAQTPKAKFADFGGVKIHYKDIGKGKNALVFVHGWACNSDFWQKSINAFPDYRVIALDLPGHGQSDKPKTTYTMDYFANSIDAVLRDAGVKKAVVVGHSMGTPVARQFYRLYSKKTLGIVIVDGSLRWYGDKASREAFYAPLRADYRKTATQFVDGMLQPVKEEKLKQFIRSAMLATPDYVGLSAMEGFNDDKLWETDKISVPVLAIMADSPWWTPDTKDFYNSVAPDLDFQMWKGVSHFLMMEKPAEFNEQIRLFITRKKLL